MNIDCQWISKNLEALFCNGLAPEEDRLARTHIESCPGCKEEVAALTAIDPLIKSYFQRELSLAGRRRSPSAFPRRVLGLTAAGVAVAAILFALVPRAPETTPIAQPPAPIAQTAPVEPAPNKAEGATSERAKPSPTVKDQAEVRGDIRPSDSASALDSAISTHQRFLDDILRIRRIPRGSDSNLKQKRTMLANSSFKINLFCWNNERLHPSMSLVMTAPRKGGFRKNFEFRS